MIALMIHEARMLTRRAIWPVSLTLHAMSSAAFVGIWGPTGGVPLWEASVLHQLTAADRLVSAVLLTWLSTYVLAGDDEARSVTDWSALTGRSTKAVFGTRLVLAAILATIFTIVAVPAFAAAGESAAANRADVATQVGAALSFSVLCAGIAAAASVAVRDRVAVWCTAMVLSVVAAFGVELLDAGWLRVAVPLAAGSILLIAAPAGVESQDVKHAS